MKVRTTLIGCGAVAQRLYQKALRTLEHQGVLQVTALVDRHAPHAEALRSVFPRASVHGDPESALWAEQTDLTLVLSPAHLHAEHAILALRHRSHVLCEKPMAITEAKGAAMLNAAREADRVLAIGMIRRYFPAFATLKEWIQNGVLGDIQSFYYREGRIFDWDVTTPAGFTKSVEGGGGVLLDIGTHVIDFLTWLFGVPSVLSYADDALGGVEANVLMKLRFPVCTGTVQLSWDSPLRNEMRIVGSKAEVVLRVDELNRIAIRTSQGFAEDSSARLFPADLEGECRMRLCPQLYPQSILCQLVQVVRAIRLGEAPAVSGEAGLACMRVIEAARRIAVPLEMPWLNPGQQQAQRALHWTNT